MLPDIEQLQNMIEFIHPSYKQMGTHTSTPNLTGVWGFSSLSFISVPGAALNYLSH